VTAFTDDARVRKGLETQLAARRQRIAAGEKPLGWKMGFGAPAALTLMKLPMPLIGYLMAGAQLPSGATVDVKGYLKPVAEPGSRCGLAARCCRASRRRGRRPASMP
jgi:2-keto-4-pentenoate hydratase